MELDSFEIAFLQVSRQLFPHTSRLGSSRHDGVLNESKRNPERVEGPLARPAASVWRLTARWRQVAMEVGATSRRDRHHGHGVRRGPRRTLGVGNLHKTRPLDDCLTTIQLVNSTDEGRGATPIGSPCSVPNPRVLPWRTPHRHEHRDDIRTHFGGSYDSSCVVSEGIAGTEDGWGCRDETGRAGVIIEWFIEQWW